MPSTMRDSSAASHREELADVRGKPAKADLRTQGGASSLHEVAADTIRAVCGKASAAAIDIGIHEGHLSRQLSDGTIRLEQLEKLGPAFAAKFGQELVERFGALATPKARGKQKLREIKAAVEELDQLLEQVG